jgi:hypothetical protein
VEETDGGYPAPTLQMVGRSVARHVRMLETVDRDPTRPQWSAAELEHLRAVLMVLRGMTATEWDQRLDHALAQAAEAAEQEAQRAAVRSMAEQVLLALGCMLLVCGCVTEAPATHLQGTLLPPSAMPLPVTAAAVVLVAVVWLLPMLCSAAAELVYGIRSRLDERLSASEQGWGRALTSEQMGAPDCYLYTTHRPADLVSAGPQAAYTAREVTR